MDAGVDLVESLVVVDGTGAMSLGGCLDTRGVTSTSTGADAALDGCGVVGALDTRGGGGGVVLSAVSGVLAVVGAEHALGLVHKSAHDDCCDGCEEEEEEEDRSFVLGRLVKRK